MAIFWSIFALIVGLIVGSMVNMSLVMLGHGVIPLPEGADVSTMEALAESIPLFSPIHFVFPFLAHALGVLVGAIVAFKLSKSHSNIIAYLVSLFFLMGGIINVINLPSPLWFEAIDLVFAYIPMAWLAVRLMQQKEALKDQN